MQAFVSVQSIKKRLLLVSFDCIKVFICVCSMLAWTPADFISLVRAAQPAVAGPAPLETLKEMAAMLAQFK